MKQFFIVLLLALSLNSIAQSQNFESLVNTFTLQKHLNIIASAEMEGRETGTEGQRRAAKYIEQKFKEIGLTFPATMKGFQQYYPLLKDSLLKAELEIGDYNAKPGEDFIINLGNNEPVKLKASSITFAGYGIEDANYNDYKTLDVKNKVLVMFSGEPKINGNYLVSGTSTFSEWTSGALKKISAAASKGAVAVLFINPNQEKIPTRLVENARKTNLYYPRPPAADKKSLYASISHAFALKILGDKATHLIAEARSGKPFSAEQLFTLSKKTKLEYNKSSIETGSSNVLGVLEGTDRKDEYVFVTGHYDHLGIRDGKIYFGADDDGSGTCTVLSLAEAFAKAKSAGHGPRRTMVFMTVSGEEKGLWGSEYYTDHPVFPLEKTTVDLNIDMIGRIDTERKLPDTLNYIYVVGHDKISTELPTINESVNKKYNNLTLDYKFDDPNDKEQIYYRSDHYNFARKGVPVLFFYDGMLLADYHRPTDTVDKINWPLYEKRARMIFETAWEMANRDDMLKRDLPVPTEGR